MNPRFVLFSLFVLTGCRHESEAPTASHVPLVRITEIHLEHDGLLERRGEVGATARVRLGFRVPGTVRGVFVREGDVVKKGRLLAVLDDTSASASLRDSEAGLTEAKSESDAARALVASGSIPSRQYTRTEADLGHALARQALAVQSVSDTRLYAPIDGQVVSRHLELGEVVEPGAVAFIVDDRIHLSVRLGVSQHDVARVHPDQEVALAPVRDGTSNVAISGEATLTGYVASVTSAPDPGDALYTVEIRPKAEPWTTLRPGAQVVVRFNDPKPPAVLRVPLDSLVHRRGKDLVFVVVDEGGVATAHARTVTLGWSEGTTVVLADGLKEGERIVTEGAYFLQDGDRITTTTTTSGGAT
jgi:RND family efflux transporter MFP subunit